MCRLPIAVLLSAVASATPVSATALVTFEHAAPAFGAFVTSVLPLDPYAEAGLTFLPAMNEAAIFSAFGPDNKMAGNTTDWFGFSAVNRVTIAPTFGNGTFRLGSLRLGPITLGAGPIVNGNLVGHQADGSVLTQSFANLATATTVNVGWSDLKRVEISADDALGVDDIDASIDPIPPLPPGHVVLRFEGVTTPGRTGNFADNVRYVDPDSPYREAGYQFVTSVARSGGVTDGTSTLNLVGEATDWLGFTADNSLTLTREEGDGVFDLDALVAGPLQTDFNPFSPADVTLTGTLGDGSTVTGTFTALGTATRLAVGWTGLTRVVITSTQLAGIDNVEVSAVPEPSVWASLVGGLGCVAWAAARAARRRSGSGTDPR